VPIRTARLTKAGPQPCAAASLPAVDSNHDPPRPERGVLPVGPAGIGTGGASRTRIPRGLSSRGLPVASLPRAPPGARTPFSGLRVQCFTRIARGAQSGPPRIRTGNLLLAGELLCQLELAAHVAACYLETGSQDRPSPDVHSPPGNRPAPFNCVPLCSCQPAGTCTHWVVLRMDGRNRTAHMSRYIKTARRAYPRERLPVDACASIQKLPWRRGSATAARTRA
jgi:hypothetical protein